MNRVIIAGGRDFDNLSLLESTMNEYVASKEECVVICGMARGADRLGELWAKKYNHKVEYFPANWELHGKQAGYKRNVEMAEHADSLVAFWDGKSKGTKHMIDTANKYGLDVTVINY